MLFSYFIIFFIGAALGSFLNVLIYRLPKEEEFLISRSYCPQCRRQLFWRDLIPLLSFILLKGRCRYCRKPIPFRYPLIELSIGFLLCFLFYLTNTNLVFFSYFAIISFLLALIFFYDFKYYIIPNTIVYFLIFFTFIFNIFFHFFPDSFIGIEKPSIINIIFAALFFSFIFFLVFFFSEGKWLGFGDVKLMVFMGLFLGFPNILIALFAASALGSVVGLILILLKKKNIKSEIPFGPFLIIGTYLAFFYGKSVIDWYLFYLK